MSEESTETNETETQSIDPAVKEELSNVMNEDEIMGMYSGANGSEERIPLVEEFSPDAEEWGGKTIFGPGQPRAITLADNLVEAFPVLLPTEEMIDTVISDYEMRLTSLEGTSRNQLMRIFMAMFGKQTSEDGEGPNSLEVMFSAGPDDD